MKESLHDAGSELKRVDHQIYVSLKYTRTVDVLLNTVSRMIDAYTFMIDSLLKYAVEKRIRPEETIPMSPIEKGNLVKELFPEEIVIKNIDSYFMFRKLHKIGNYKREQEFRRHVALKTIVDDKDIIINIDVLTEYYDQMKEFFEWVTNKLEE